MINNVVVILVLLILLFVILLHALDLLLGTAYVCRYLGWHNGSGGERYFDGVNCHSVCSKCNEKVMRDSQGNWFTFESITTDQSSPKTNDNRSDVSGSVE